jgi:ATP-dependent helicase YprA (DUF1998 family)
LIFCFYLKFWHSGGYDVSDRRRIEQQLFSGQLLGCVATNALELGMYAPEIDLRCKQFIGLQSSFSSSLHSFHFISFLSLAFISATLSVSATGVDVGDIAATLHMGFPGSIASLWQQAGRCGRSRQPSMSIMVAYDSPVYTLAIRPTLFFCLYIDAIAPTVIGADLKLNHRNKFLVFLSNSWISIWYINPIGC